MDEHQKNQFAARLQRIQAQKAQQPSVESEEDADLQPEPSVAPEVMIPGGPPPSMEDFHRKPAIGAVRTGLILLTLLGIFAMGALFILNMTHGDGGPKLIAAGSGASAPKTTQQIAPPAGDFAGLELAVNTQLPREPRNMVPRGQLLGWTAVATPNKASVQVSDIALDFDPAALDRVPKKATAIAPNSECSFRRPTGDEVVHNVRIQNATVETDLHVFSDAQVVEALMWHIEGSRKSKRHYRYGSTAKGRMARADVFVTETSAPVYLVLQSWGNTLWNVHRGQGVQIAHIAVIGENSGVIPPNGVSVEALRISDFVTDHSYGANDEIRPCMIAPYRNPEPHWPIHQDVAGDNQLMINQLYSLTTGFAAFNAWYTEVFGVDADTNLTSAEGAAHVLVGPVPTAQLAYKPLNNREAFVTEADHILLGDVAALELHVDMLRAAAGGDLTSLYPAPVVAVTQ